MWHHNITTIRCINIFLHFNGNYIFLYPNILIVIPHVKPPGVHMQVSLSMVNYSMKGHLQNTSL